MKVRQMLQKLFFPVRREEHRHTEACRETECDEAYKQELHDMATRLHVLEWEAYGPGAVARKARRTKP